MELKKRLKKVINTNKEPLLKKFEIIAIITTALKDLELIPVIVGGQAVEFYTEGGYATRDIDLI